jgi:hypothetical protein
MSLKSSNVKKKKILNIFKWWVDSKRLNQACEKDTLQWPAIFVNWIENSFPDPFTYQKKSH